MSKSLPYKENLSGLTIFQKLRVLFGVDYVVLKHHDGEHQVKPVRWLGGKAFAAPYLSGTSGMLLPHGKFQGKNYVKAWLPITKRTHDLFKSE